MTDDPPERLGLIRPIRRQRALGISRLSAFDVPALDVLVTVRLDSDSIDDAVSRPSPEVPGRTPEVLRGAPVVPRLSLDPRPPAVERVRSATTLAPAGGGLSRLRPWA